MNNILTEIDFSKVINEGQAQTQTGSEILSRYRAVSMNNETTCALVNNFVKEASQHRYDNGLCSILEHLVDFITSNSTRWQIATACENINANNQKYNYLNLNAAKQAEKLLEMNEDDCVRYIKSGALKNVMYCNEFRNIAKSVFKNSTVVVENTDCKITHPVSIVEKQGTDVYFEVLGKLYKINESKEIAEAEYSEVSNTFKNVTKLLESNLVQLTEDTFCINYGSYEYQLALVTEGEGEAATKRISIVKLGKETEKEFTVESLREDNRLTLMTTNPRFRNQAAEVLECIAQLAENLDRVVNIDYAMVVETKNDKFVVIESEANVFASLIQSNHNMQWTINEEAMKSIDFIKSKTKVDLSEQLHEAVKKNISNVSEEEKKKMEEDLKNKTIDETKARIAALTEKFKDDPAKLAVLSKLAQDIQDL